MEEAPTITEEFEEVQVKKVEKKASPEKRTQENVGQLRVARVSFSPPESPLEKSSASHTSCQLSQLSGGASASSSSVNWNGKEMDALATGLQAGYKGMKTREEHRASEEKISADMKNKEIEEALDIDLDDPDVVKATTKIQAGFRGAMTRKTMKKKTGTAASSRVTPEIVVDMGSDSSSEYTYTYIEESEEEDSESLGERPDSPLTAIGGKAGAIFCCSGQSAEEEMYFSLKHI